MKYWEHILQNTECGVSRYLLHWGSKCLQLALWGPLGTIYSIYLKTWASVVCWDLQYEHWELHLLGPVLQNSNVLLCALFSEELDIFHKINFLRFCFFVFVFSLILESTCCFGFTFPPNTPILTMYQMTMWQGSLVPTDNYHLNLQLPSALRRFIVSFSLLFSCPLHNFIVVVHSHASAVICRRQKALNTPLCTLPTQYQTADRHN